MAGHLGVMLGLHLIPKATPHDKHETREEGCGAMLGLHRDPAAVSLDEHENSPAKMEKGEGKRIAVGLHLIPPIL